MSSTLNIAVNLYRFGETKSNPAITVENVIIIIAFIEEYLNIFNLKIKKKNAIEKKIVAFLDDLLGLMNEEVPKNWHYFRQYFYVSFSAPLLNSFILFFIINKKVLENLCKWWRMAVTLPNL
jgi:hypothetical protein